MNLCKIYQFLHIFLIFGGYFKLQQQLSLNPKCKLFLICLEFYTNSQVKRMQYQIAAAVKIAHNLDAILSNNSILVPRCYSNWNPVTCVFSEESLEFFYHCCAGCSSTHPVTPCHQGCSSSTFLTCLQVMEAKVD